MMKWAAICAALAIASIALAQASFQVSVEPILDPDSPDFGRYVAHVRVLNAPSAREVVFRVTVPAEYTFGTAASDITVQDVRPGADVYETSNTKVVFAEQAEAGRSAWVVALLKDDATVTNKHVCDVVFTVNGCPTHEQVIFSDIVVKDGSLNDLGAATQVVLTPRYGDFDWSGRVNVQDFMYAIQAWRVRVQTGKVAAFADVYPHSGDADPGVRTAQPDGNVNVYDAMAVLEAWRWEVQNP